MKIYTADNYEMMSKMAALDILSITQNMESPLLCTASGHTPAGLYKALVDEIIKNNIDISGWYFVSLDEWMGLNGSDEGSCRFHLNNQLFNPLHIKNSNMAFFDGKAADLEKECENVEHFINGHGGITIAILGVGINGHVGMNEPGTSPALYSHVTELANETKKMGQKYFTQEQTLSKGITLGIATLMKASHIFLMASGRHKAEIVQQVIEAEISNRLPATFLRQHPALRIYLDKDAASLIDNT